MDLALRDRERIAETEDQAVFLGAMDGIQAHEGVVFVFTTNCSLELIDRAFKRPGRLDLVLHFKAPEAILRRRLLERWHKDIREALSLDQAVASTEGFSFAEIEELKNLLVMRYMDCEEWEWDWALKQFAINRSELTSQPKRHVGFGNHATRASREEIPF
jgi:SpoVK/Ycf46/Vps4 family AAA+-type ATPase